MKFWIVDQIGETWCFADEKQAREYAAGELAKGALDLTVSTIDATDIDVLTAVSEVACRKGGDLVERLTETPADYL